MALSTNERAKKHKDNLKHGGLFKRRDFYVHPDDLAEMRELEAKLRLKRLKEIGEIE
jgi:hypothetical protein